jgi:hypothetical protein
MTQTEIAQLRKALVLWIKEDVETMFDHLYDLHADKYSGDHDYKDFKIVLDDLKKDYKAKISSL